MIALVTGANRGLGLATGLALARTGYEVVMTARDLAALERVVGQQEVQGLHLHLQCCDVSEDASVAALAAWFAKSFSQLDALINNAGAILDRNPGPYGGAGILDASMASLQQSFNLNTLGALRMIQAFMPFLKKSPAGRIVNVSSGMGGLSEMGAFWPGYRMSKAAMNAVTRMLHAELAAGRIKVNSVCPGWVRTDMGGPEAARSIDEGIQGIIWAATLPEEGPSGGFYRDGLPTPW
jgi:NAD(P)-dependent dehydrogenase (short-subunit alcohol dehydrogenase family)